MVGVARRSRHRQLSDDQLFAVVQQRQAPGPDGPDRFEALELLFERYHARVHAHCERLLGAADLADDATQEIFLGLLVRNVAYENREHFGSWLYIVLRNHCLNMKRRRSREILTEPTEWWDENLMSAEDPQTDAQRRELADLVGTACKERLNAVEQEVLHLRYFWGMRVKEIDRVLGLQNVSGARTHLATAKRKLRESLPDRLGERRLQEFLED